ncbi:hypothetical protein [Aminicella lysinilytica]|nr:hypothetical protein [Aminicella lysinilytica]
MVVFATEHGSHAALFFDSGFIVCGPDSPGCVGIGRRAGSAGG